jgi:recombination protein RecA
MEIMFGKGVSAIGSLLDAAVKYEIIDKKGAWYSYGEEKVGQGRDSAKDYLEQNPAFALEVEAKLRKIMFPGREFSGPAKKPAPPPAAPVGGSAAGTPGTASASPAAGAVTPAGSSAGLAAQGIAGGTGPVSPAAPAVPAVAAAPAPPPMAPGPRPAAPYQTPPEAPRGPGRPRKAGPPAAEEGLF